MKSSLPSLLRFTVKRIRTGGDRDRERERRRETFTTVSYKLWATEDGEFSRQRGFGVKDVALREI